jgi:hypothetical protein
MKRSAVIYFICLAFLSSIISVSALSNLETPTNVYNISLSAVDSSFAIVTINNINSPHLTAQNSPYTLNYPVEGLYPLVKKIFYASKDTDTSKVTLLFAYEENLTEECMENWNCSDWSSCSNSQQTRTCTDLSSCGTIANKPVETQGCGSPNPSIECFNDNDCMMPSMGSPYCEGSSQCIGYLSYKCIKAGTTESYCNSTSMKSCNICPNGCENNICINQSQPVKECDNVGLRQSGKYCSTEYKLITQKSDGVSCENNFECKINSCLDSKCGKEQPSKLIYWIIGIVAVLIIIGLIIYLLRPKSE